MKSGRFLLGLSIFTRLGLLLLLAFLAYSNQYLNYKLAYNLPRLVELDAGRNARFFYEQTDNFYSSFGDPVEVMQSNGGMTWSIRLMGLQITDPIAALSVLAKNHELKMGFLLGLVIPLVMVLLFGRVFCAYICPASLIFFAVSRLRKLLSRFFYFPEIKASRGLAWGILFGSLILAVATGHGIWAFVLPYFAVGQVIFHSLIFKTMSITVFALIIFVFVDLLLGNQFTCRSLCPTGRLLGFLGQKSLIKLKREKSQCLENCSACNDICPMAVTPKMDFTRDCTLCGECLVVCPAKCLSIGTKT
jgi:ferredoxin-type protein NapH